VARTRNPHEAAVKSWQTRRRSGPTMSMGDWRGDVTDSASAKKWAESYQSRRQEFSKLGLKVDFSNHISGEATVEAGRILLSSKFASLPREAKEHVFTHEVGHIAVGKLGLKRLVRVLEEEGIDPWDVGSLPFGQFQMEEAFAEAFAESVLDPDRLGRANPKWLRAAKRMAHEAFGVSL
jgi:hypothetical protein